MVWDDPDTVELLSYSTPICEQPLLAQVLLTWFGDRHAKTMDTEVTSLCDLARKLSTTTGKSKDALPHIKLGRFGNTTALSPSEVSYRCKANHENVTGVEGDYDEGNISPEEAAQLFAAAGVAALIYTSPSHGLPNKGNRWRILALCKVECEPSERYALVARLNGVVNGALADESFTSSLSFTFGTVENQAAPISFLVDGRFIDECDDLDAGAIGKSRSKFAQELGEPLEAEDQSDDPEAVQIAKSRFEYIAERVAETEAGENRNAALNKAAFCAGGFLACSLLSEEQVIETLLLACDENGYSTDYGDAERVIRSGLKSGMKYPTPVSLISSMMDDLPEEVLPEDALPTNESKANVSVSRYSPDQDGAIRAFTDRHREALRYAHDRRTWYHFEEHTWQPERTALAKDFARKTCMTLARQHKKEGKGLRYKNVWDAVESGAQADRAFASVSTAWDNDPMLLGTPAGIVDLRTGEVRTGQPEDMVSKRTSVHPIPMADFVPELDCPSWIEFLDFALNGDVETERFLAQWSGMSLTGDTTEQKLLFIHGGGGNGKGVAVNTLARVAGEYAANVPSRTLTAQKYEAHSTELARLQGVRFAHASEVERDANWADARIKSLSGGDPITARYMRSDDFTFYPQLTLTVVGNDRPSFGKLDEALRRRFLMLEMDRKPERPDLDLPEKLWSEARGILSWMIQGALDWQKKGLVVPKAVRNATDQYFIEEDYFGRFLAECGKATRGARVATTDLVKEYEVWASGQREAPWMSDKEIAQEMKRRGFASGLKVKRRDGGRGNGFEGFQLTVESE